MNFDVSPKLTKLSVANLGTLLEGTVFQIFCLRLSSNFMTKNGKYLNFFKSSFSRLHQI